MGQEGRDFREAAQRSVASFESRRNVDAMLAIWHMTRIARHAESRFESEVHRPRGWNWTAFRIMINISLLGPMEPSRLASILEFSRASVTVAINNLEEKGLVRRASSPDNKKQKLVSLTAAGQEAVVAGRPEQRRIEVDVLSALDSDELATLNTLLQKVYDGVP